MKHILMMVCSMGLIFFGLQPVLAGSYSVQFISWDNDGVPNDYIVVYTNSTNDKNCATGPKKVFAYDKGYFTGCNSQDTTIDFTAEIYDDKGTQCGTYTWETPLENVSWEDLDACSTLEPNPPTIDDYSAGDGCNDSKEDCIITISVGFDE